MGLYGRNSYTEGSKPARSAEWGDTGLEESMWHLDFSGGELYPERPGVSDCVYYMQTGLCGFGTRCRYNHPRDRSAAIAAARLVGGEYPERPGEPVCQYYLKTGTCKFGQTCKFNHPRNSGGSLANAPLNFHGYPLRPGEKECSYYLKTGQCKYGIACKFHHPQPAGMSIPAAAPPFYPTVQSPSVPMRAQAAGSSPNYRMSRPPLLPGSFVPGTYPPMLVSPGVVPMPSWTSYSGPVSPALSPGAQPPAGAGSVFGVSPLSPSVPRMPGPYPSLPSSLGLSNGNKEYKLPERPDEPECQYYMKTGSCKFGAACKYHHPPDRASSTAGFFLGPLGLPLRPGAKSCTFYLQNGYCKFGPTCKFDHPLSTMKYSPSSSSLCNIPVAPSRFLAGSSLPTLPNLSFSAELQPDCDLKSHHVTDSDGMQSGNSSVALMFMKNTSMNVEQPSHSMGGHNEVRAN